MRLSASTPEVPGGGATAPQEVSVVTVEIHSRGAGFCRISSQQRNGPVHRKGADSAILTSRPSCGPLTRRLQSAMPQPMSSERRRQHSTKLPPEASFTKTRRTAKSRGSLKAPQKRPECAPGTRPSLLFGLSRCSGPVHLGRRTRKRNQTPFPVPLPAPRRRNRAPRPAAGSSPTPFPAPHQRLYRRRVTVTLQRDTPEAAQAAGKSRPCQMPRRRLIPFQLRAQADFGSTCWVESHRTTSWRSCTIICRCTAPIDRSSRLRKDTFSISRAEHRARRLVSALPPSSGRLRPRT